MAGVFIVFVVNCFDWLMIILSLLQKTSIDFCLSNQCICEHENSKQHKECLDKWIALQ